MSVVFVCLVSFWNWLVNWDFAVQKYFN